MRGKSWRGRDKQGDEAEIEKYLQDGEMKEDKH